MARKSEALHVRDIRAADRLAYECAELGHDPAAWQGRLVAEMGRLCHLPVGMHCELTGLDAGETPQLISVFEAGWPSERVRRAFFYSNGGDADRPEPFSVSPVDVRFRQMLRRRRACARSRSDLIDDAAWHGHPVFNQTHRPAEMDEILMSAVRLPKRGSISLMAFGGRDSRPGVRERKVLALMHRQVAVWLGNKLATACESGRHGLTEAQRDVFDQLRLGHSEKTIAAALHRSRSTVSEHVANIYRVFNVHTRAELMATLLDRHGIRSRTGRDID